MPPQQGETLLDRVGHLLGFGAHDLLLVVLLATVDQAGDAPAFAPGSESRGRI
jgi:hypothetical protein